MVSQFREKYKWRQLTSGICLPNAALKVNWLAPRKFWKFQIHNYKTGGVWMSRADAAIPAISLTTALLYYYCTNRQIGGPPTKPQRVWRHSARYFMPMQRCIVTSFPWHDYRLSVERGSNWCRREFENSLLEATNVACQLHWDYGVLEEYVHVYTEYCRKTCIVLSIARSLACWMTDISGMSN